MAAALKTEDQAHLRRALELAEGGRGKVSPNPLVGAVIVRDDAVIGEGFHAELGDLHAERAALADCGEDPRGATMYVSLEPCAHQGRQPPCAEAILEAGIGRVVIASDDPSEKAAGRGPGILRDGGVEVEFATGEEATAARLLNQPFRKHARTGLPLVTLKLAMSLDGQTETPPGDSPWISSAESQALVHRWRAESDAVAVGIGTVLADDPLLTARTPQASRQPLRVVFDRQARLPLDSHLLQTLDQAPVLVVISADADPDRHAALRSAGAEILVADEVGVALSALGQRGTTSVFLEGGRTLASAFLAADAIDEARTFVAPVLLGVPGGEGGGVPAAQRRPLFRPDPVLGRRTNSEAKNPASGGDTPTLPLHTEIEKISNDVLIVTRFKEW
jgi:diaminohydroxyphosphoribosylaminopyrimidine deaminase / 5-amino-6-(5-phosphoribosylamino)uracil reductase